MNKDSVLEEIDAVNKQFYAAFEKKELSNYLAHFDEISTYLNFEPAVSQKGEFAKRTKKYFNQTISISHAFYRIKSSFADEIFSEKIARKYISNMRILFFFSKKQTTQTEEIILWKKVGGKWKIQSIELVLEEIY